MLVEESAQKKQEGEGEGEAASSNSEDGDSNSKYEIERKKLQMRREARRKKILENSKNRLAKLGGREIPISNGTVAYEEVSDPEVEPDIPNLLHTDIPMTRSENFQFVQNNSTFGNMDFNAFFASMQADSSTTTTTTTTTGTFGTTSRKENFWQRTRLHVILIALMTFVSTVYQSAASGWSVFTLLGICLISELLFFTREREVGPLVNLAILLCGIQPQLAKRLMHLLLILYNIFTDLGIFVFCYSMFSIMFVLWDENNVDLLTIN